MINLVKLLNHSLGEDAVCKFISSMIEESKIRSDVMKKKLTKNL